MTTDANEPRTKSTDGSSISAESNTGSEAGANRRTFLKATGGMALATAAAGCLSRVTGGGGSDSGEIGDSIKIGVLAPEPANNPIGASIANSAKLAAKQLNKNGGIAGANVGISIKDTKEDPTVGQSKYRELTSGQGVDLTTGVFTSEVLLNIMDDIARTKTIHMTAGAATPEATRLVDENYEKYKYHFRTGPFNAHYLGANMVDFAQASFEQMGWKKIALLIENYKWTAPISAVFKQQASQLPAEVVTTKRYAGGTSNFTPIFDQIASQNVDGAFVAMAHTGTAAVTQWAKQQRPFGFGGIHVPMQLPAYYDAVGGACQYAFTQNVATPTSKITKKTIPFSNAYNKEFDGYPVYTGYITFDAIMQFASVVEKKQSLAADKLISGLESGSYTGTAGTIEYYPKGHKYTHDLVYRQKANSPVYAQWQKKGKGGVQQVFFPKNLETGGYKPPAWL
ncbi:MAG TPA: ABC transporter substrate-binding protein [Halococcus sp.]|nr:ABC transporter substrate-binding protein [Halococcus sp.]